MRAWTTFPFTQWWRRQHGRNDVVVSGLTLKVKSVIRMSCRCNSHTRKYNAYTVFGIRCCRCDKHARCQVPRRFLGGMVGTGSSGAEPPSPCVDEGLRKKQLMYGARVPCKRHSGTHTVQNTLINQCWRVSVCVCELANCTLLLTFNWF